MTAPAPSAARILRFDPFELNLHTRELRKRGVRLRLHGQPIDVLAMLLESAGTLVTRDELRSRLWPADTFVNFDHGLHNAIARVREVLGDSAEAPRYIETLPRRGYRFIAPVEEVQATPIIAGPNGRKKPSGSEQELQPAAAPVPRRQWTRVILTLCCCAIAATGFVAWQLARPKAAGHPIRSIAVLPLQDLSGEGEQAYFAEGMTDELITEISRIPSLKVISRTSVMEYKGTRKHLPQIARELGADGIVEGSVVREGDQVRITVQLLDAPEDRHLWSEEYQRPLHDVLTLQREIARAIAQQVSVQTTTAQQARLQSVRAVDPEAFDAYLRGRFYLYNQTSAPQPLTTAKSYFDASIRKDPGFAPPYAGMAGVYITMAAFRQLAPAVASASARQALTRALELDEGLSEAHSARAVLSWRYDWDWAEAEREFNLAIALDPSYECVRADHANYLAWRGRRAEALPEIMRGRELNPGDSYYTVESSVYYQLGDYARLIDASRTSITLDPNEWLGHYFLGVGYEGSGRRSDAIPEFEQAVKLSGGDQDPSAALAHAYAVAGNTAAARRILDGLTRQSKDAYVSPYMVATIYAGLGDKDRAFALLEQAVQQRCLDLVWNLKSDPRVDSLRSDPRFQALWRRIGFPQ